MTQFVNSWNENLAPYPMEELTRIRQGLEKKGVPVFDFGTGDPTLKTWEPIRTCLLQSVKEISQYPSVKGTADLKKSQLGYLSRRFDIKENSQWDVIPSAGSKEAIFHISLCLSGRLGRKNLFYPDPGYPVYRSSAIFAGANPCPIRLEEKNSFLIKPWLLPKELQTSAYAIWVNYPHNPTGYEATKDYWEELINWCHATDTILLSDDCYVDLYDPIYDLEENLKPATPLQISSDRVLTFMSLSKRSGMTGYRSGLIAGDTRIIQPFLKARANFGVGSPEFVSRAATVAWNDDRHVTERREIFAARMKSTGSFLQNLGLIDHTPRATFYLWCKIPAKFGDDDIKFVLKLAELGVITSPSQWLSEGIKGYFRMALVPGEADTQQALSILKGYIDAG